MLIPAIARLTKQSIASFFITQYHVKIKAPIRLKVLIKIISFEMKENRTNAVAM